MRRNSDRPACVATRQRPDGSIDALLQFSTELWTDARRRDRLRMVFGSFPYCPFTVHFVPKTRYIRWNGLKQAKWLTARIDSEHAGLALTV